MARSKETLVLLLDVSASMHPHLPLATKLLSTVLDRKLMLSKSDELGLVLFGATETENELNEELGGYESIVVSRPIAVVDEDVSQSLENIPRGTGASDFLDAIVVGIDMIIKKLGQGKKANKRICLITDAESRIREPEEGTVEEQVDNIAGQMAKESIKLEAIVVRIGHQTPSKSTIRKENEAFLRRFESQAQAEMSIVRSAIPMLGAIRPRTVAPTTLYRGDLELTPSMSVKVWVYKKTAQEKFPTLKKFSDNAPSTDPYTTHEVKVDMEYKSSIDPDVSIPPEQRTKAYKYGHQYVPISGMMEEAHKFKTEKGIKLIGFMHTSKIPRHYYLKESNVFVPEPGHTKSMKAVSALARALQASDHLALVRCVWRQAQVNVVLGVLTPYISTQDNVADGFYFNVIPFADDMREFPFNSFSTSPEAVQPSEEQQEAADNLVGMLNLAPDGGEEKLQPELTINPILQRFYRFLHARALNPQADIPPLDEALCSIVKPDTEMWSKNSFVLQQYCRQFTLIPNVQKGKVGRRFWRDKGEGEDKQRDEGQAAAMDVDTGEGEGQISFDSLTGRQVEEVGSVNPVKDFEALLARRDSDDWIPKAVQGMKNIIRDLLDSAYNGNTYEKALACLCALRAGCVVHEEPQELNNFLRDLAKKCRGKRLNDFWEQIVGKGVTLISKEEAPDSDVLPEEAAAFLAGGKEGGEGPQAAPEDEIDEMEALLGEAM